MKRKINLLPYYLGDGSVLLFDVDIREWLYHGKIVTGNENFLIVRVEDRFFKFLRKDKSLISEEITEDDALIEVL